MSLYSRVILPRLIDLVMGNEAATAERAKLVPAASGTVLEIGVGSAHNMPHYGPDVRAVYGIDPSVELWEIGRHRLGAQPFPVQYPRGIGPTVACCRSQYRHGRVHMDAL